MSLSLEKEIFRRRSTNTSGLSVFSTVSKSFKSASDGYFIFSAASLNRPVLNSLRFISLIWAKMGSWVGCGDLLGLFFVDIGFRLLFEYLHIALIS